MPRSDKKNRPAPTPTPQVEPEPKEVVWSEDPASRDYREVLVEDIGGGIGLWRLHIDALREQDVNARAMSTAQMNRLSATMKRDKRLESLPLVAVTPRGVEVVSGHHRTRAARSAGLTVIPVLVDTTDLSRSQIIAKQLAHNSLQGEDNVEILRRLYEEIDDVDARLEAFLDPKDLELQVPDRVSLPAMDLDIAFKSVLVMFLPHQADMFERAAQQIVELADLNRDDLILLDKDMQKRWDAMMRRVGKEYDARAMNVVMERLILAAADHLGLDGVRPEDVDPGEWVAFADLFKSAMVPPDAAEVIRAAVEKYQKDEKASPKNLWQVVEMWAADYLGGA